MSNNLIHLPLRFQLGRAAEGPAGSTLPLPIFPSTVADEPVKATAFSHLVQTSMAYGGTSSPAGASDSMEVVAYEWQPEPESEPAAGPFTSNGLPYRSRGQPFPSFLLHPPFHATTSVWNRWDVAVQRWGETELDHRLGLIRNAGVQTVSYGLYSWILSAAYDDSVRLGLSFQLIGRVTMWLLATLVGRLAVHKLGQLMFLRCLDLWHSADMLQLSSQGYLQHMSMMWVHARMNNLQQAPIPMRWGDSSTLGVPNWVREGPDLHDRPACHAFAARVYHDWGVTLLDVQTQAAVTTVNAFLVVLLLPVGAIVGHLCYCVLDFDSWCLQVLFVGAGAQLAGTKCLVPLIAWRIRRLLPTLPDYSAFKHIESARHLA